MQWSQQLHGMIAALDINGNTDILSFQPQSVQAVGETRQENSESAFALPLPSPQTGRSYTPKWL